MSSVFHSRPNLIDMNKVYRQTNLENLEQAFSIAERDMGVTRLLDPEGKQREKIPLDSHSKNFPSFFSFTDIYSRSLGNLSGFNGLVKYFYACLTVLIVKLFLFYFC